MKRIFSLTWQKPQKKEPSIILLVSIFLLVPNLLAAQPGFFLSDWQPKTIQQPEYVEQKEPFVIPGSVVEIDVADTVVKISPYIGGYNLNTYHGGKIYNKPRLLEHIRNLDLPFFRFPGGSGSNWYFWNHTRPNRPDDVNHYIKKEEVTENIKWGDIEGEDYLGLDDFYRLRDSTGSGGINVINYSYARYGRSEHPVQQAAHYAAEWVRHDNGKTQFWEIGNEHYGAWEAGYEIDTSENKDGQPKYLDGSLYARHSRVFIDSMRAAANELGINIRIGTVIHFKPGNGDTWNASVMSGTGDVADFFILHKYFGNNNDAAPDEVFQSIDDFYESKDYIDNLMDHHLGYHLPLVWTEWNTRYAGSQQNVSCANGIHNLLGYKGVINEGFGLSCKWNLIWAYHGGSTHGLITSDRDNSEEGMRKWQPRAPYFFIYYFRQILGDASLQTLSLNNDRVDAFASAFSSGQTGVVLANTSNQEEQVAVNLNNYSTGSRYYWYILTGTNHEAFDRKVQVNGITNQLYDGGGPLRVDTIPAFSARADDGIKVELPPYSAAFLLVEGEKEKKQGVHALRFKVYGRKNDSVYPLEKAAARMGPHYMLVDSGASDTSLYSAGTHAYAIEANGYETYSGTIDLSTDTTLVDTLVYEDYTVDVKIQDSQTDSCVENLPVEMQGMERMTDSTGVASFSNITFGDHTLMIDANRYAFQNTHTIWSDTLITLELNERHYQATFQLTDVYSGDAIAGANVEHAGQSQVSDLEGMADFEVFYGDQTFSISKSDYHQMDTSIFIPGDTLVQLELTPAYARVKFEVDHQGTPVNGANVALNEMSQQTNSLGITTFEDLDVGQSYDYSIMKTGYESVDGVIDLKTDTTLAIDFEKASYAVDIRVTDRDDQQGIDSSVISIDGEDSFTDATGSLSLTLVAGSYSIAVSKEDYADTLAQLDLIRDTSLLFELNRIQADLAFKVLHEEDPVEGAQIEVAGSTKQTDDQGKAIFADMTVDSSYAYSINKEEYVALDSSVYLETDTLLVLSLRQYTGLGHMEGFDLRVYPNPTKQVIHGEADAPIHTITLWDNKGKLVFKQQCFDKQFTMDLSALPEGVYWLRCRTTDHRISTKQIIRVK